MHADTNNLEQVKLSSSVTIGDFRKLEEEQNRQEIARFVQERFSERYTEPLLSMRKKHGFCMMAICCLLIEAITAFRKGWQDPTTRRNKPYREFFAGHPSMAVTPPLADAIYDHIRSGIFHLGETTGGWRILRRGPLVDSNNKTVNAMRFLTEVQKSIDEYCLDLRRATWNKPIWQNFRNRMNALIRNCHG